MTNCYLKCLKWGKKAFKLIAVSYDDECLCQNSTELETEHLIVSWEGHTLTAFTGGYTNGNPA